MQHATDRFRFDETRVISEVIEGEIVVVQFETGCYYSIRGTGADTCRLLLAGHTMQEVVGQLAAHHHLPESQIGPEVEQFVMGLVAEQLLVASIGQVASCGPLELSATLYSAPSFEKFDDMADQLLLDPIHEIGAAGWPIRPAA